jgi:hypothetical protein
MPKEFCGCCYTTISKWNTVRLQCGHIYHVSCIMESYNKHMNNGTQQCCEDCNIPYNMIPKPVVKDTKSLFIHLCGDKLTGCKGINANGTKCNNSSYPTNNQMCKIHGKDSLSATQLDILSHQFVNLCLLPIDQRVIVYNLCKELIRLEPLRYHTITDLGTKLSAVYAINFVTYKNVYKYYGLSYKNTEWL